MKKSVVFYGTLNCGIYILLFLLFRVLGLLEVFGISMVNFVTLFFALMLQFRRQIKKTKGYIPFLEVFSSAMATGTISFILFATFMFIYSIIDPQGAGLYIADANMPGKLLPFIIIFFQGSGGSIIVALAITFYTSRFEDGEAEIEK